MTNHYLFIVEGSHDAALLSKIINILGFAQIKESTEVLKPLNTLIKTKFPFTGDSLNVFNKVPTFYKKDNRHQICIINANGERNLLSSLNQAIAELKLKGLNEIKKIVFFADGDLKYKDDKIKDILDLGFTKEKSFTRKELEERAIHMGVEGINIPIEFFIFPNNQDKGRLEEILLEAISKTDLELLQKVDGFLDSVPQRYKLEWNDGNSQKDKTRIACVGNVLMPGVSSAVFIGKSEWICDKTIKGCQSLKSLYQFLKGILIDIA